MNIELTQTAFIADIKQKIRLAQYEALKAVNVHLINLYWEIGKSISEKQAESWYPKVNSPSCCGPPSAKNGALGNPPLRRHL